MRGCPVRGQERDSAAGRPNLGGGWLKAFAVIQVAGAEGLRWPRAAGTRDAGSGLGGL